MPGPTRRTPRLTLGARASIKVTVDTYGRWLPMGNKAAVHRLDEGFASPEDPSLVAVVGLSVCGVSAQAQFASGAAP